MKKVRDHYFHRAKREGYAARSAFKLEEIDRKHRLLHRGMRVLDLGCSPGSWLQYAAKRIGSEGCALGVDLQPVDVGLPKHVKTLQGDVFELTPEQLPPEPFDLVLSDMAPRTSGIRSMDADRSYTLNQQVLGLSAKHLRSGGNLLVKAFQGAPFEQLRKDFQDTFEEVHICKPRSSRSESVEVFLLGLRKHEP